MTLMMPPAFPKDALEAASKADWMWPQAHHHRRFRTCPQVDCESLHSVLGAQPLTWQWSYATRQIAVEVRLRLPLTMEGKSGLGERAAAQTFEMMRGGK
jgi:hypothetical protein